MATTSCPTGQLIFLKTPHSIITHKLKLVPAAVLISLLPLLPESPRWLLMHDRTDEALDALRRYSGHNLAIDDERVQAEYMSIRSAIEIERKSHISFKQVMFCRDRSGHLKRLLLGCGGQFMQVSIAVKSLFYVFLLKSS